MNLRAEALEIPRALRELDEFTESHETCSPFQTGPLVRAYAKSPDTIPSVLVARDSRGSIVASLAAVSFTHGGNTLPLASRLTRHCTIRGSPPAMDDHRGEEVSSQLIVELPRVLLPETLYIRFYPDRDPPAATIKTLQGYSREDWLNYLIDLSRSENSLLESMSKHRRKGIHTAEREGVEVREVSNFRELTQLYTILEESHRRLKVPIQRKELFQATFEDLRPRNQALLMLAQKGQRLLAGRVVVVVHETAYDWYAGSLPGATEVHANEFLAWSAMMKAKLLGATTFDFGGAGTPREDYGPREFKRRFGGAETNYGRYTKVLRPRMLRVARTAADILRRI